MITISLSMIVKNEENTIGRCLESVKDLVDEIIIVDTGSTDKTKEVVRQYTDLIFDFQWIDDFAAARNYSFEQASMDYILWLDADDVLLEEDQKKFLNLINDLDSDTDSVSMHYHLETDSKGNVISSLRRNRLVKRKNNFKWYGAVHEYLDVSGNIIQSEIAVTHFRVHHDSDRNLRIYENRFANGKEFSPRDLFYFANELFEHKKYQQAIDFYKQFLETKKGWVEDNISACGSLADCYHVLGEKEKECQYIFNSFKYDTPRAEFCCRMGHYCLEKSQPRQAIFWYNLATQLEKPTHLGRINHACWTWLPHMMLCSCYVQLDMFELAYEHNEVTSQYLPDHANTLEIKKMLEMLLQQKQLKKEAEKWHSMATQVDQYFHPEDGMEKLQITFLLDHANLCGGVKSVLEYSNYLVKRGHNVSIVCHDPKPDWLPLEAAYIQVPLDIPLVDALPESDIIITTFWRQMVDCYKAQKAPVIHFEQGDTYIFEFDDYDASSQELFRYYWSVPIPIIVVSSGLSNKIEKIFKRKPQILPYALNDKVFYPRSMNQQNFERPCVLFVGPEQWPFKGISDILTAITIVQQRGYEIEPVWVTQFPPVSPFEGSLYVSPSQKQLGELYRAADIYVCGSYYESFGLPALEAMTCGCAVISTNHAGVFEYAEPDQNCLLTNIGDPSALAEAIIELLQDEEKRARLVRGGYETAKKFNIELVIDRFEQLIYGALKDWKRE